MLNPQGRPVGASLLLALAGLTALFVSLGPGASGNLSVPLSTAYWLLHIGTGLALCVVCTLALERWPRLAWKHDWMLIAAAGLLASLLFAPVAILFDGVFPPPPDAADGWLDQWELRGGWRRFAAESIQVAPEFVVAWLLINAPPLLTTRVGAAAPVDAAQATSSEQAIVHPDGNPLPWDTRLPPAIGRDVVAVSADLHYLHVRTLRGKATVLGTLEEAERALGADAVRIHRSHLVVASQVRRVLRKGTSWLVETATGDKLPVSRRRAAEVRARLGRDFVVADPHAAGLPPA